MDANAVASQLCNQAFVSDHPSDYFPSMKAVAHLFCLMSLWMLLFAGRSPESVPAAASTPNAAHEQGRPDEAASLAPPIAASPTGTSAPNPTDTLSAVRSQLAARSAEQAASEPIASPLRQQLYLACGAVLTGLLGLRLALRRSQVGERRHRRMHTRKHGRQAPHNRHKTHMARGLWITLAFLSGLVLVAATLLAAAGALGLFAGLGFSLVLWMSLGILCAVAVLCGLAAIVVVVFNQIDFKALGFWGTFCLFFLLLVVGLPLAVGIAALVFWIFLNLLLPITVGIFLAAAVMGIVLPGFFLAMFAMATLWDQGK